MKIVEKKFEWVDGKLTTEIIEPTWFVSILRNVVEFLFKKFNYEHFKEENYKIIKITGLRTCLMDKGGQRSRCSLMHKIGKYHI